MTRNHRPDPLKDCLSNATKNPWQMLKSLKKSQTLVEHAWLARGPAQPRPITRRDSHEGPGV